jgi:atypical dual specificity phosphatase
MFSDEKLLLPEFPSTPHITIDQLKLLMETHYVTFEEKLDGANCGMTLYNDEPLIRNRRFILRKGYSKRTKAKDQFLDIWGWFYRNKKSFETLAKLGPYSVYGEWLAYTHVIHYDRLPSMFIAYDIYDWEAGRFLPWNLRYDLIQKIGLVQVISYSNAILTRYNAQYSYYATEQLIEGVYCRASLKGDDLDPNRVETRYKLVRDGFKQIDWLDSPVVKNKLSKEV